MPIHVDADLQTPTGRRQNFAYNLELVSHRLESERGRPYSWHTCETADPEDAESARTAVHYGRVVGNGYSIPIRVTYSGGDVRETAVLDPSDVPTSLVPGTGRSEPRPDEKAAIPEGGSDVRNAVRSYLDEWDTDRGLPPGTERLDRFLEP